MRSLERAALAIATRTGWTRTEILSLTERELVRHLKWLK